MTMAKLLEGWKMTLLKDVLRDSELKQMETLGNRSRKSTSYHAKDPQTLQISICATNQDTLCSMERNNPGYRYIWMTGNRD